MKWVLNLLYALFLFFTPYMCGSMESWIGVWSILELNVILFLGLLIFNNRDCYDAALKYFLISSVGSIILLYFLMDNNYEADVYSKSMMIFLLWLKMGMFPFHHWYVDIMSKISWLSCLVLSTWQKIILMLIFNYLVSEDWFVSFILFNLMFAVICAFRESNLKKFFAYSSMVHISWMMMSVMVSLNLWYVYFFCYFILNFSCIYLLDKHSIFYVVDFLKVNSSWFKINLVFLMFSLGGLPPFLGFLMKWFFAVKLLGGFNVFIMLYFFFFSLIFLYYYIRLCISYLFTFRSSYKFNFKQGLTHYDGVSSFFISMSLGGLLFLMFFLF